MRIRKIRRDSLSVNRYPIPTIESVAGELLRKLDLVDAITSILLLAFSSAEASRAEGKLYALVIISAKDSLKLLEENLIICAY